MSSSEQFASDNYSGVCPEAWNAMAAANTTDEPAYGEDSWTQRAADGLRALFDTDCDVYFVFNGTAANSLALASIGQSFHSVICHELAHIETDECGGPEYASNGAKLLLGEGENGKLTPESIEHLVTKRTDIHYPKPKALSLTQATEVGTVYSPEELRAIRAVADRHRLHIHMDGARFANAVAALDVHPSEITWKAGVDVLCFSGTKNGLALGEAVVFFNKALAEDFEWRCKQAGQLASKMRYGVACSRMRSGYRTPGTPTPVPHAWRKGWKACRGLRCATRARSTVCLWNCPSRCRPSFATGAGAFTTSSVAAPGSCVPGQPATTR